MQKRINKNKQRQKDRGELSQKGGNSERDERNTTLHTRQTERGKNGDRSKTREEPKKNEWRKEGPRKRWETRRSERGRVAGSRALSPWGGTFDPFARSTCERRKLMDRIQVVNSIFLLLLFPYVPSVLFLCYYFRLVFYAASHPNLWPPFPVHTLFHLVWLSDDAFGFF